MTRRLCLIAAATAAALAVAPAAPAGSGTVTLTRTVVSSTYLDRAVAGRGAGDQTVFRAELRNSLGAVVGSDRGFCTIVHDGGAPSQGPFHDQCRESVSLPQGQLDLQGFWDEAGVAAGAAQTLAITGGSGAWTTAHGEGRFVPKSASKSSLTLSIDTATQAPKKAVVLLTERASQTSYLDRYLPGRGEGDETYTTADVSGASTGTTESYCLTVTDGNGTAPNVPPYLDQCQQTFLLSDGSVVVEGLLDRTAFEAGQPQTLPIVGGTKAYNHAHGEAVISPTGPGTAAVKLNLAPAVGCVAAEWSYAEQGVQFAQISDPNDPQNRGPGDLLTSMSELADAVAGTPAGSTHAFFLTTDGSAMAPPLYGQASQTIRLADGTIEMGGAFSQTDFEAYQPQTFLINGGTGAYARAHGTVTATQTVYPATFRLDVHLACDG